MESAKTPSPRIGVSVVIYLVLLKENILKKIIIKKAAANNYHVLGLFDPIPMQMRNLMNRFGAEVVIFHFSTGA